MPNSLILSTDHENSDPRSFCFAVKSTKMGRITLVHMTDEAALKVAHRIMALASCGGNAREVFEGE